MIQNHISSFFSLFYPDLCYACDKYLSRGEEVICISCRHFLPKTNFHQEKDNPVEKHFWGRVPVERAAAFLYFTKQGKVQKLLHLLKYKGKKEVGIKLGALYGQELKNSEDFNKIDLILPVPLHPQKERRRGYNQSEMITKGMSAAMGIPSENDILVRKADSQTQTKKSRVERWQNVASIFEIKKPENIENKQVLLVDDVITTGSTLEACANTLIGCKGTKVSIATIAVAQ